MRDSRNSCTVKPCDICGDIGFEEKIVTCFQCQSAREHVYCMRVVLFAVPEVWLCEACRSSRGLKVFPKSVEHEPHSEILTSVAISGKAMKLSSLAQKEIKLSSLSDSLPRSGFYQKHTKVTKSKRIPSRFKTTPRTFPTQMLNANPGVRATAHCSPLGQGSTEKYSVTKCQVSRTSTELKDKCWYVCKEEPEDSRVPANKVETSNARVKDEAKLTYLTSMDTLPIICSGDILYTDVRSASLDIKENSRQIMSIYDLYKSFFTTSDATWCGSIKIHNLEPRSKFFDGFQAYPANKVHRKALQFSKQMPGVLLCSLLPRCNIWLEVFQDDHPTIDDIGLIFSPGNFQRSKEQYVGLLGLLEMQDGVLKSCINGVELLIFSSKSFHGNSSGLKLGSFLWGLYNTVKGNMVVPPLLTYDLNSQAQENSSKIRTNIKQSLSKVKIEPYCHPDVPPGFPRQAADAAAGRCY